jgi:hypothetical protein
VDEGFLKRSRVRFYLLILAPVLALVLTTAGTARAVSGINGPHLIEIEGGATDSFGTGESGHLVVGGLVTATSTEFKTPFNITIAFQDNAVTSADAFICKLTNPADLVISGGAPTVSVTLTVSATGDTCFETAVPAATFSNVGKALTFRGYIFGNKMVLKSTGSTLKDSFGDLVGNVALSGEILPSGGGSNQAGGDRMIEGGGGAVDFDDDGFPSGHIALAGFVRLNPLTRGATTGTARTFDLTLDYEDHAFADHLACHFTTPGDVSYTLSKGVGTLTITVGTASECTPDNFTVTPKKIVFMLYVGGSRGVIVSTSSTLFDSDSTATSITDGFLVPAVIGEFSAPGGL